MQTYVCTHPTQTEVICWKNLYLAVEYSSERSRYVSIVH